MKKGLGRGLSVYYGEDGSGLNENDALQIPVSKIEPNDAQPRRLFNAGLLDELSESIKIHGVISPITVRRLMGDRYQIIAGERRWRAAKQAGLEKIPVVIIEADDKKALELALVENLQRENLNPIEEAEGYRSLMEDFGLTQEAVAERVGKSRPTVANTLRLLTLPETVKATVGQGKLSGGHARALLAAADKSNIEDLARRVAELGLTVRETEDLIKSTVKRPVRKKTPAESKKEYYVDDLERKLSAVLGRRVVIQHGKSKGKIELEYYGLDDLEQLVNVLETGVNRN